LSAQLLRDQALELAAWDQRAYPWTEGRV